MEKNFRGFVEETHYGWQYMTRYYATRQEAEKAAEKLAKRLAARSPKVWTFAVSMIVCYSGAE